VSTNKKAAALVAFCVLISTFIVTNGSELNGTFPVGL
jgi:hypothetical protein